MSFYRIRPRAGTASQWELANPILGEREIGIEAPPEGIGKGQVKIKLGDGVTAWNDLPYAVEPPEIDISDLITQTLAGGETDKVPSVVAVKNAIDSVGMYYDPETDIEYLKNTDGEWVERGFGGLSADFLFKAGDGLQCSYVIANSTRFIVEDTGDSFNIQQNAGGTTATMVFSKSMAEYIGQGKRLYFKAKALNTEDITIKLGSTSTYTTSPTATNITQSFTFTQTENEISLDIDTTFTNSNKYLGLSCASSENGNVLCITEMKIK